MSRAGRNRGRRLFLATSAQFVLVALSLVLVLGVAAPAVGASYGGGSLALLIVLLGSAMGLQNATARSLAVPDLTTTVLTLTITGMSADSHVAGGAGSRVGRRLLSVLTMFAGGLIGVVFVRVDRGWVVLAIALVLLAIVAAGARHAATVEPTAA